ncbi:Zinc finger C2H2 [Penicillium lagena]|uniref:Zinc finger C2H2 n=1 Tax=Penicillium lagena TaxID=94218 RepID=UPI0025411770|nr:Zinc finger C2H2 [Penicillium lagena]KAJ5623775.1 Zinc finger C2H2 [Penicillium lagena]
MEDPTKQHHDPDILQGLMVGHDALNLSHSDLDDPSKQPSLAFGDSLLDLHLGADLSAAQPSPFLWSSSIEPHALSFSSFTASRLASDQDAWNPLQVTGVPGNPSSSLLSMNVAVGDGFSQYNYHTASECGSQYIGSFHSTDSGYDTASCGTQPVVKSSYGVDEISSPQIDAKDQTTFINQSLSQHTANYGIASDLSNVRSHDGPFKCGHPYCSWVGKCPADKRKHDARHRKLFKCDESNCTRTEGFGTINDLARHKKCVHNKKPERGPKMVYMCFGKQCFRRDKTWPRLDNFKQHITRMHGDEDADLLLKRSMDWYETAATCSDTQTVDETGSQGEPMFDTPQNLASAPSVPEKITLSRVSSLDSDSEYKMKLINAAPEAFLAGAADNLIRSMTRIISSRARKEGQKSNQGINLETDSAQLSKLQRHMLQKVLAAALERLSDENAAAEDSEKTRGWFQCDTCPKRTRLRCEMKKHQKRHERPYGCTFPHCPKAFGSKADWKRHESSQHLHIQSWLCTFHDSQTGACCEKLFYQQDSYTQHLRQQHGVPESGIRASVCSTRLDMANQSQFWCGFCNHTVSLRNDGQAAWDERFDHIDSEHFKKGERGQDWCFPLVGAIFLLDQGGPLDECPSSAGPQQEGNRRKRKLAAL